MVVVDSSFLIAYHNARDAHHGAAARAMVQLLAGSWGRALLLEYVFLEVVTVLSVRRDPSSAVRAGRTLLTAREVIFVPCTDVFLDAWGLFQEQRAPLSFADAAIAVVARQRAEGRVLTFDAGFRTVDGLTLLPS